MAGLEGGQDCARIKKADCVVGELLVIILHMIEVRWERLVDK